MIELSRRRRNRLNGQTPAALDPLFAPDAVHPVSPTGPEPGITLAELIKRFTAERTSRLSPGKAVEYSALFRLVKELWSEDKQVRSINRADCRAVRDLVSVLPPHAAKRWPRLTLRQVAERARQDGIAPMDPATANAYLSRLSTLLRWAEREEYTDRNPAVGLQVAEPEGDPRHARHPFSPDQLQRIVGSLPAELPWRRWIALLGLFTGARLNEICGLATEDITEQDGVHVILIRPDTGRGLKTPNARRVIPVHPELVRCGFLAYVEERRAAGETRLFPLDRDSRGRFADRYQKWFSRFLERAGAKAPKTGYHSFRHNFRDALREADVARDAVLALGGWSTGGTEELYGGGLRPSTLGRAIAKVRYPALDLSHLYPR